MAGFARYREMLEELAEDTYDNTYVNKFIEAVRNQNFDITEPQRNEIVRLYNIYRMPKKFAVDSTPIKFSSKRYYK